MEEVRSNSGQGLGVAALITGIVTFILAVIPCVGVIAIIPGIIAIILAAVGLSQTSGTNAPRGILLAGLIIGIVAVMIAFSQFFVVGQLAKHAEKWPTSINKMVDDVKDDVLKELEDANVSIKIESNGEKVEINTGSNKRDIEKLEELEKGDKVKTDTIKKVK